MGGNMPRYGCDAQHNGAEARVDYKATYCFYMQSHQRFGNSFRAVPPRPRQERAGEHLPIPCGAGSAPRGLGPGENLDRPITFSLPLLFS